MTTPAFRINQQIQASQVRLLREDGTQIGVVTKDEALAQAQTAGVDVVEIAPLASPPVAKLVDFKKFLYQLAKKQRAEAAATKKVDLKEIRLTPFMGASDLQVRLNWGRDFLLAGHKLKVNVKFVGRQLTHKEFGDTMMQKVFTEFADMATVEQSPKWVGRVYVATLTPIRRK